MAKTPYLEPSDELLVIKTDKKVFHVHPKLEENPSKNEHNKVFSEDSKVCFCINDNRYGKGDKAIRTYFNLSLAEFYSVQRAVNKGYLTEGNFLKKFVHICGKTPIHGDVCPSHHMTVSRQQLRENGEVSRNPWCITIENGTATRKAGQHEGQYSEVGDSFKAEKTAMMFFTDDMMCDVVRITDDNINDTRVLIGVMGGRLEEGRRLYAEKKAKGAFDDRQTDNAAVAHAPAASPAPPVIAPHGRLTEPNRFIAVWSGFRNVGNNVFEGRAAFPEHNGMQCSVFFLRGVPPFVIGQPTAVLLQRDEQKRVFFYDMAPTAPAQQPTVPPQAQVAPQAAAAAQPAPVAQAAPVTQAAPQQRPIPNGANVQDVKIAGDITMMQGNTGVVLCQFRDGSEMPVWFDVVTPQLMDAVKNRSIVSGVAVYTDNGMTHAVIA